MNYFFLAGMAFFGVLQVQAAPTCNAEQLVGKCSELSRLGRDINGVLGLPRFADGSVIYNGMSHEQSATPPSQSQISKAEGLAAQIRDAAKETIVGRLPRESWSFEQRAMIARLETLHIRTTDASDRSCLVDGAPGDPNARYDPYWHEVVLCPELARLAPPALAMILAHEIGHVISPCTMGKKFYDVTSNNRQEVASCLNNAMAEMEIAVDFLERGNQLVISSPELLRNPYSQTISKLTACGLIKERSNQGGFRQPGVFQEIGNCLNSAYRENFDEYQADRAARPPQSSDPYETRPELKCHSVYEEHFAEAFGAKVFGKMLEKDPKANDAARVGLVQMLSYSCSAKANPRPPPPSARFRYPRSSDRVHIQMSDPNMQRALNCTLAQSTVCTLQNYVPGQKLQSSQIRTSPSSTGRRD